MARRRFPKTSICGLSHRRSTSRFRTALAEAKATYYKLTPPFELRYVQAGHGFHFVLGRETNTTYLDVMGRPPRMRDFRSAQKDSRRFASDWGNLPTIGLRDLIELKKTQRLADYPIISALTLRWLEEELPSPQNLAWAGSNLFMVESFFSFNERFPAWVHSPPENIPGSLAAWAGRTFEEILEEIIADATRWMSDAMARQQKADRHYWRKIIAELRNLRRDGMLVEEGLRVTG